MGILHRRPLASALLALILAFITVYTLMGSEIRLKNSGVSLVILIGVGGFAVIIGVVCTVCAVRTPKYRIRLISCAISMLFLVVGLLRAGSYFAGSYAKAQELVGESVSVTAEIRERESSAAGYARYRVNVRSVTLNEKTHSLSDFDAALVLDTAGTYAIGDTVSFVGTACALSDLYAYPAYAVADGYLVGFSVTDGAVTLLPDEGATLPLWARMTDACLRFRNRISFFLSERIGGDVGAFASAILLGDRAGLDARITRDFGRAGIAHLLALSGLHMSILIGGLAGLLRRLRLPRRAVSVVTLLAIFAFLMLTGFSMSACRAGLMLSFAAVLGFFSRRPDPLTSLFIAVSVLLLLMPSAVASVGLWMSVSSVLGLLLFAGRWTALFRGEKSGKEGLGRRFLRVLQLPFRAVLLSIGVSVIASFSVLPILWLSGGEFSLFGVLTNLLTVSLMPVFLVLSLVLLLCGRIVLIGPITATLLRLIGTWILSCARIVSEIPHASISLSYPFAGVCVAVFLIPTVLLLLLPPKLFARLRPKRRRREKTENDRVHELRARWFLIPPLFATLLFAICLSVHLAHFSASVSLPVTVHGVSGGEMLTVTDGDSAVLVDLSPGYASNYRTAADAAAESGVTEWSRIVLTEYKQRHLSSLPRFCKSHLVREVLLPTPETDGETLIAAALTERLSYEGIPFSYYDRGAEVLLTKDLSFTLSRATFLKRSTQSVFWCMLSADGDTLVYLSQSIEESDLKVDVEGIARNATVLVYGSRGPIRKLPCTASTADGAGRRILIYGDENRALIGEADSAVLYDPAVFRVWKDAPQP